ncbi:MAG: restriction endonuclease subunit S [Verrucomicrobiae bacterium]|nr:restriction endonuclease subunit S [Verrucomicrobiae bacterium]
MSFPRYPEYKDSGVEWLGEVPGHWEVRRIGSLFHEVNEAGDEALPILCVSIHDGVSDRELDENEMERKVSRSEDRSKYKKVLPGDLVYNMMRAWQGGFGAVAVDGMVSPAYVVARPRESVPTFLVEQLLRTPNAVEEMRRHSRGITDFRLRLYWGEFKEIAVTLPPAHERTAISAFLERETAKIDALVAEQQRLIELLKEKRQAVISHVVTKGLNPDAPMKDSGIEWFGEVPAHWTPKLIKFDLDLVTSGSRGWAQFFSDDGDLFFRITNIQREHLEPDLSEPQHVTPPEGAEGERSRIRPGDILISITADLGSVTVAPEGLAGAYVSQHVCLARPGINLCPRWAGYALKADCSKVQFEASGYGGTKIQLSLGDVRNVQVALPPLPEQETIAAYLDAECGRFDTLTAEAQRSIDLLQERRTTLISAAVTGQIDIRAA